MDVVYALYHYYGTGETKEEANEHAEFDRTNNENVIFDSLEKAQAAMYAWYIAKRDQAGVICAGEDSCMANVYIAMDAEPYGQNYIKYEEITLNKMVVR